METKDLKVSAKTQKFIECISSLDKQYRLTCEALEGIYGVRNAEEIMDRDYSDAYNKLRKITSKFLLWSIDESIARDSFTEI